MFSVDQRDRLRDRVFEMAKTDRRVVGGAVLGSLAHDDGDEWSDLDLMLAVADGVPVTEVLEGWGEELMSDVGAVPLFDLPSGSVIYRVFLLPGCLELDLSFVPASEFGPEGPSFEVVFGPAIQQAEDAETPAAEVFGYAVHHALHARVAIERGRYWQAEHWISALRDKSLHLACLGRGLDGWYGRDFDRLPAEVLARMHEGLVRSLDPEELRRALEVVVAALLRESTEVSDMAAKLEGQLREIASLRART
jgi:predicted nucleotidyltransferase